MHIIFADKNGSDMKHNVKEILFFFKLFKDDITWRRKFILISFLYSIVNWILIGQYI